MVAHTNLQTPASTPGTNRNIPFFSTAAVNAGVDLLQPIRRVMESQRFVLAAEVRAFEEAFAAYCGVPHCVSVANGTDALQIALQALGVQAGQRVLLVANAGFYGSTAVRALGAHPWYVDVDGTTANMDPSHLAKALSQGETAAIIVTHLYGTMAPVEELVALAKRAGVPLVEDCAQAHGAQRDGQRVGSFGDIGTFSFYPTKNLGALGDGGALVTRDASLAERIGSLRQYGWTSKYDVTHCGGRNSRLDEMQAAVLREKLPLLDGANEARRQIARKYVNGLVDLPLAIPRDWSAASVGHLFVVQTPRRDALRAYLKERHIGSEAHYPIADHMQAAYPCSQRLGDLPETERLCDQVMSLPCYPGLTDAQVDQVLEDVRDFFVEG